MTELEAADSALFSLDWVGAFLDTAQPVVLAGIAILVLVVLCALFGLCKHRDGPV